MDWEKVERVDKSERQRSSVWKTDDALSTAGSSSFLFLFTRILLTGLREGSKGKGLFKTNFSSLHRCTENVGSAFTDFPHLVKWSTLDTSFEKSQYIGALLELELPLKNSFSFLPHICMRSFCVTAFMAWDKMKPTLEGDFRLTIQPKTIVF